MKTTGFFPIFRHAAAASALALVSVAGIAHAEPDSRKAAGAKPSTTAKQRAEQHLQAGNAAFEKQDYTQAIIELEASYAEVPNPAVLYALGQAHRLNGNCTDAVTFYRKFVDTNPTPKQKQAATEHIDRCEKGAPAATTPPPVVDVPPAKTEPPPEPPPKADTKNDTLLVDTAPRKSKAWYQDVPGDLLVGTGVAAAAVGTVLFLGGRSKVDEADDASTEAEFEASRDDADSGKTQQTIGVIALGAGGALLTAGIIRWVTVGGGEKDSAHVRIGPTWGGLMATGAF